MTEIKLREIPKTLRYICIHWTAGAYDNLELGHYHFTVDKAGKVHEGKLKPESNIPPLINGKYVEHCGGGNSYCIGLALIGMAGYKGPKAIGKYPLTAQQCEAGWAKVAELCRKHDIPVDAEHVFTHYEFGKNHPRTSSAGKIDIVHLPHKPELKPEEIGDYIRGKVTWYLKRLEGA